MRAKQPCLGNDQIVAKVWLVVVVVANAIMPRIKGSRSSFQPVLFGSVLPHLDGLIQQELAHCASDPDDVGNQVAGRRSVL